MTNRSTADAHRIVTRNERLCAFARVQYCECLLKIVDQVAPVQADRALAHRVQAAPARVARVLQALGQEPVARVVMTTAHPVHVVMMTALLVQVEDAQVRIVQRVRAATMIDPSAQVPDAQVPSAQVPGAQVPGAQVPSAQVPGAQVPDAQVPAGQARVVHFASAVIRATANHVTMMAARLDQVRAAPVQVGQVSRVRVATIRARAVATTMRARIRHARFAVVMASRVLVALA